MRQWEQPNARRLLSELARDGLRGVRAAVARDNQFGVGVMGVKVRGGGLEGVREARLLVITGDDD